MSITAPTDIANCQAWFDAADAATLDSPGGLTYSWTDKSGNSRAFTFQSGKPLAIVSSPFGGERMLRVVAAGGYIRCDALATYFTSAFTCFLVCCPHATADSDGGGKWTLGVGRSSTATPLLHFGSGNGLFRLQRRNDSNSLATISSSDPASNDPCLITIQWTGTTLTLRRNGVQIGSVSSSGTMTLDQFAIGVSPRNTMVSPADCQIAQLILYSASLSSTDRDDVEAYLMGRYATSLANQHLPPTGFPRETLTKMAKFTRSGGVFGHTLDLSRSRYSGASGLYYVDWVNGSDSNSGASGSPFKTISKALAQSDVCGIELAAGLHPGTSWNNTYTRPDRSVTMWCASSDKAIICNAEDSVVNGWTLNTGATYETTRTVATTRVVDLSNRNADHVPQELTSQSSIAAVDANPGSYFSDSGTGKVYVRTFDSRPPDVSVVVQIGAITPRGPFTSANRFLSLENLIFVGASTGTGVGSPTYDFASCVYFRKSCETWYGTEWDHAACYEVCCQDCWSGKSSSDVLDYRTNVIGLECGCDNVDAGTGDADNSTTCHNNATKIACNCNYRRAQRVAHDINTTNNWYIDTDIKQAIDNGGADVGYAVVAGSFGLSEATKTWLDGCRIGDSDTADLCANDTAFIKCRYMRSANFSVVENGTGDVSFADEPKGLPIGLLMGISL